MLKDALCAVCSRGRHVVKLIPLPPFLLELCVQRLAQLEEDLQWL